MSCDSPPPPPESVRTDARTLGRSYGHVITKFSGLDGLPNFLTHGAPLARFARWSSAIIPPLRHRSKERTKYDMLLHCRTGQKDGRKAEQQNGRAKRPKHSGKNSGIINPLLDGLTYNTSGHLASCSYFSEPRTKQLAKYPRALYVKTSNKVYLFYNDTFRS